MANYANLLATIAANIYSNGNNEVTAAMVKTALDQVVASLSAGGYLFKGIATPTSPGSAQSPDEKVFYIATTPGTYTYLGGVVTTGPAVITYNGAWSQFDIYDPEIGWSIPYNNLRSITGWVNADGTWSLGNTFHHVVPIRGGETIKIQAYPSRNFYIAVAKSYSVPMSTSDVIDFATGESARSIKTPLTTFTAPDDARYIIVGSYLGAERPPKTFWINDYNVLSGTRERIYPTLTPYTLVLRGDQGTREVSSEFSLRAGKKYRISFASDRLHVYGTTWLSLRYGNTYMSGVDDNGNAYTLSFTESAAGVIDVPKDCIFSPEKDDVIWISTKLYRETCLVITFMELDSSAMTLLYENNKHIQSINRLKSILVENMITGGKSIGEPDATLTYIQSHVFVGGECFVAAFRSKTMLEESDPNDCAGGLIVFSTANPENTSQFFPALSPGDVLFEGQDARCDHVSYCMNGLVDDGQTIRVIMLTSGKIVYKDFDIATKTYEQYCHMCQVNINGTLYDLERSENSQIIQETLGLTKYLDGSNLLSFGGNPIEVGGEWYTTFNFYGWSRGMFKTADFATWTFVSEYPYPYLCDEWQLCYAFNRIYATATGNIDRRTNGYYSAILFYNTANGSWSSPLYLEGYGHDACAMACVEGQLYVMHQKLWDRAPGNTQQVRADNWVDGYKLPRSRKTIFVYDKQLNEIGRVDMNFRRAAVTCHFGVFGGNLYIFGGTNSRGTSGDGRQTGFYSFVDIRLIDL